MEHVISETQFWVFSPLRDSVFLSKLLVTAYGIDTYEYQAQTISHRQPKVNASPPQTWRNKSRWVFKREKLFVINDCKSYVLGSIINNVSWALNAIRVNEDSNWTFNVFLKYLLGNIEFLHNLANISLLQMILWFTLIAFNVLCRLFVLFTRWFDFNWTFC